jgi:hypothetical protein
VYIEEAKTWMDGEVTYNKNLLTNEKAQIRQVATERLRVSDGLFIASGNTAEKIRLRRWARGAHNLKPVRLLCTMQPY